jgi:hypothetical protein
MTYGEQMLANAERKIRARAAKRRRLTLLIPSVLASLWALIDLVVARSDRLGVVHAGFFRHVVDHGEVIVWTIAFVIVPIAMSVKPDPIPAGALLAFFAGPVLTPLLFGSGGWKLWQSAIVTVIAALILAASHEKQKRARTRAVGTA